MLNSLDPNIPITYRTPTPAAGIMHNKFLVIDANSVNNSWIMTGSTNWTNPSNLFNDYNKQLKSESNVKLTPLYVFKVLESWISDKSLKYTPDGYVLTKTVDIGSLPNFEDIDSYYHQIFDEFESKWRRILESALSLIHI